MIIDGERFVPVKMDVPMITYEHWHRYYLASEFIKDKVVLDIACGTGYGTKFLSQKAKSCIGIDISSDSIEYAIENFSADKVQFKQGSITDIPLDDNSVDILVSFETIEHVDESAQKLAMKEYKRVLKEDGILFISSPNIDCWDHNPNNPFHLKEFITKDFVDFLQKDFKYVSYLGQEVKASSSMHSVDSSAATLYFSNYNNMGYEEYPNINNETYIIAVCSNSKKIELQNSILIDSQNAFMKKLKEQKVVEAPVKQKKLFSFNISKKRKICIYKEYK